MNVNKNINIFTDKFFSYKYKKIMKNLYNIITISNKHPLSSGENLSPIFIIGSGRSGNTLLRRILTGNPDLYIPPETYVLGKIIKQYDSLRFLNWEELCTITLGTFSTSEDFETFPKPYLRELNEKLIMLPEEKRSLSKIVNGFYELQMKYSKSSAIRWGDKTPVNSFSLHEIDKLFPSAKYIHLVRNPYDVIASYIKMGRYNNPLDAANRWVSSVSCCRDFLQQNENKVIEIKYEDLCDDPEKSIKIICEFVDLSYSKSMIYETNHLEDLGDICVREHYSNVSNPININSIGKGINDFNRDTICNIDKIIFETKKTMGYN